MGTATVTATGKGNYKGKLSRTFTITPAVSGDINKDGSFNMKDLTTLQRWLNGWQVDVDLAACDTNGDGKYNMKDIVTLQRRLNGWDV